MTTELIKRLRGYLPLGDGSLWSESSKDIARAADALEAMQRELDSWQKSTAEIENKWIESCDRLVEMQREIATRDLVIQQMREVLPAFRPEYGAVGSRDVDVAKQIAAYDKAISLQPTTEHLDAYVAEKVKEATCSKQAEIDRLMLEFCPDEMTEEQITEWSKHQVSTRSAIAAINALEK